MAEDAKETAFNSSESKAHAPEADSLESCVFGLFNEIVGRMNKDISDILRPKTSEVASAVRTYQAGVTQKTSEIEQLQENTGTELVAAAGAVQEFQNRIASELGAMPSN
ncbi:hypothetical protein Ndes2526B_g06201 [Nannochloris sp. 'desiccata']